MIEVAPWLQTKGVRLRPEPAALLQHLLDNPGFDTWTEVAELNDISPSTARHWMRKKGLPVPSQWYDLSRALEAASCIHDASDISLERIAKGLGYVDHTGLSRQLRRAFGLRAADLRRAFDPDELVEIWWERQKAAVPA